MADQTSILLVEDDPAVLETSTWRLEARGFRVLAAADGPSALELFEEIGRVDLLLADVVLPGAMSGLELGEELKRRDPDVKVLLMSGYSRDQLVGQGTIPDDCFFLTKPFPPGEPERSIHELLGTQAP